MSFRLTIRRPGCQQPPSGLLHDEGKPSPVCQETPGTRARQVSAAHLRSRAPRQRSVVPQQGRATLNKHLPKPTPKLIHVVVLHRFQVLQPPPPTHKLTRVFLWLPILRPLSLTQPSPSIAQLRKRRARDSSPWSSSRSQNRRHPHRKRATSYHRQPKQQRRGRASQCTQADIH